MQLCQIQGRQGGPDARGMALAEMEFWRVRLTTPAYRVAEAACYARTTQRTIGSNAPVFPAGMAFGSTCSKPKEPASRYSRLYQVALMSAQHWDGWNVPQPRLSRIR